MSNLAGHIETIEALEIKLSQAITELKAAREALKMCDEVARNNNVNFMMIVTSGTIKRIDAFLSKLEGGATTEGDGG